MAVFRIPDYRAVDPETNLRVLRPSRPRLTAGDVFAMSPAPECFIFGRVILADLPGGGVAPMPGANLIYIYSAQADAKSPPPLELLTPAELLIPPQYINLMPWTKNYFENLSHQPLHRQDLLRQHCFWDGPRKIYRDERGAVLPSRSEPCGSWGLGSYRFIDDLVSDALGIPRVPT